MASEPKPFEQQPVVTVGTQGALMNVRTTPREEGQTVILNEEVSNIRREVRQLKPLESASEKIFDAAVSTAIACVLQFAAFAASAKEPLTWSLGTVATAAILASSIAVAFFSFFQRKRDADNDVFEQQRRNILEDLDRIAPEH
ncbi:hypothetical protein KIH79_09215 [Bifidobacterium sp. 82T10]|uniref:Uncharacterized protein n=1 Tax=Bifidobacterium miconis TaxID=2834435 RepID=A0ABS6WGF6_9BIFI|nr:hypothetical protein [Bifidobacterium miconis]MBW3093095.1 hypothetical protein [Bifidobacterium miconis]